MTIRELARTTGVSAHALRYYERAGLMPSVERNGAGHRRYGERHVRWVTFLRRLRMSGMPIAGVRTYVGYLAEGDAGLDKRTALLAQHREEVALRIEELKGHLELLDRKLTRGCGPDADHQEDERSQGGRDER